MKITKILFLALIPFLSNAQNASNTSSTTKETTVEIPAISKFKVAIGADSVDLEKISAYKYNREYVAKANTDYTEEVVIVPEKNLLSRKKTLLRRDFFYVLNGNEGWIKIPMGSLDKKPTYNTKGFSKAEVEEHQQEVNEGIFPFIDFTSKGFKLTAPVSTVTLEGKSVTKLAIEKGNVKREYYFDNTTGLLSREILVEGGITHTTDYLKFASTSIGVKLPVEASYINTRDKRKTNITTQWTFENPTEDIIFTK